MAEYPTDKNRRSSAKSWSRGVSSKRGKRSPGGKLLLKPSKKELLKQAIQEEKAAEEEKQLKEQALEEHKAGIARDEEDNVIFRPNPGPQTMFLAAPEKEVLFGGAAGGGKSYALLADCMRGVIYPDYVALILRRTNDELRELKQKSKEMYPKIDPGAKWSEKNSEWTFSSGARIWMTYLDRDDDVGRYHGQAFSYIAFDELTYWPTPYAWDFLRSRLRTTNPNITPYMRATTNPGGPGHSWVKKMFIDPAPWGKAFDATDIQTGETLVNPETGEPLFKRRFIPSKLSDNPYLATSGYLESLLALPEDKRKALLYGNWDVAEGAAFKEFSRVKHVIEPFELPSGVKTFRACDYGYSSYSAVVWMAVMPSGQVIIVDELYVKEVNAVDLAHMVNERDKKWHPSYGVLDSSCWAKRGDMGQSIAETMIKLGCRWKPSDRSKGSRVAGKNMIHQMLADDPILNEPKLLIFDTCVNTISYLPVIPLDKNNSEDVDTKYEHDHVYDAVRYGLMSRPRSKSVFDFGDNITQMRNDGRSGAGRYFY